MIAVAVAAPPGPVKAVTNILTADLNRFLRIPLRQTPTARSSRTWEVLPHANQKLPTATGLVSR